MLKPLNDRAIRQRDAGRCTLTAAWFSVHLDLDQYLAMMDNEFADQESLMAYINDIPGFHIVILKPALSRQNATNRMGI